VETIVLKPIKQMIDENMPQTSSFRCSGATTTSTTTAFLAFLVLPLFQTEAGIKDTQPYITSSFDISVLQKELYRFLHMSDFQTFTDW